MPIRVDEDVRAALLVFKEHYETINEGLRDSLLGETMDEVKRQLIYGEGPTEGLPDMRPRRLRYVEPATKRGIRPKGDSKR